MYFMKSAFFASLSRETAIYFLLSYKSSSVFWCIWMINTYTKLLQLVHYYCSLTMKFSHVVICYKCL